MPRVDLNADVGESFGSWKLGHDAALMPLISSANIACGFHAGDPGVMRDTVALALAHGVAVGAHPGYPDLAGFGRRAMSLDPREVEDLVAYQIGALAGIAAAQGATLQHVKAHGALYNTAARDRQTAGAIARAVAAVDHTLVLFGPAGSCLIEEGRTAGLRTASEAFADRAYTAAGELVSRQQAGAVVHDPVAVSGRVTRMVNEGRIEAVDGTLVPVVVETICLHGDTPGAAELARHVRQALAAAGIAVKAVAAA